MGLFDFFKPKKEVQYKEIYNTLDIFTEASLAMPLMGNPKLLDDQNNYPKIYGYFMGVMDYIAQTENINNTTMFAIFTNYLMHNFTGGNMKEATKLASYCADLSKTSDGQEYMSVGGQAIQKWFSGSESAPIALSGLLNNKDT